MFAKTAYSVVLFSLVYLSQSLLAVRLQLEPGTKAVIKLGVCPFPNYVQRCDESKDTCVDDLDCAHEALCCSDGCRRSCSVPRLENVVGYVVLGAALPLSSPTTAPDNSLSKALAVSPDSWNLLLGYLCAVSDRLHSTNQFQCTIQCTQDSDCPQNSDQADGNGLIKCCNKCCLDPTQFIIQQKTNVDPNQQVAELTARNKFNTSQQRTTLRDSSYLFRLTTPAPQSPPTSKPGMCPPVLVQPSGSVSSASCDRRCYNDRDCYGLEKCCSNGCGYDCQRPITLSLGYGGESLTAQQLSQNAANGASSGLFADPFRNVADYVALPTTTTSKPRLMMNPQMYWAGEMASPVPRPTPMKVLLGSPSETTDFTPNTQRCSLPPTSYTECIGITPWRTRYYYHSGLNQCLPIYRCIRNGNNFIDLLSCENACVIKDNLFH